MNLATAQCYAFKIADWLAPYCERITIAGSIRRLRPICNDIDLVVIPKYEEIAVDMFQKEQLSLLWQFLIDYVRDVRDHATGARWLAREPAAKILGVNLDREGGPEPKKTALNLLLQLRKCQLDIFCATPATWATLLLCRTGSREHNIWLAERAKAHGGHWNPYKGLTLRGETIAALEEYHIYNALGLEYIKPEDREIDSLRRLRS